MKTIKFIVEIECEDNETVKGELEYLSNIIDGYYVFAKTYEYTEPVEKPKPNRP